MASNRKKTIFIISGIIILFGLGVLAWPTIRGEYEATKFVLEVERSQKLLEEAKKKEYEAMMKDAYGGKTPQETLRLYIQAIEKEDYELASRYFVREKQDENLKSFKGATQENAEKYIVILKNLKDYSEQDDKRTHIMVSELNGPDFFARFVQYPNGIWKKIGRAHV